MKKFFKKIIPLWIVNIFWHKAKAIAAACIYGFPAKKLTILVVAGTKGKTSTACYTSSLLDSAGIKNALFSTAVLKINGRETLNTLKLTTATPFFLQRFLRKAVAQGCTHAILEVSSHALVQHRLWGIPFSIVVITNLMPDHLEFHPSAAHYQKTHCKLLTPSLRTLILNGDDPNLKNFFALPQKKLIYSTASPTAKKISSSDFPLVGAFNLGNALAAFTACRALGISEPQLLEATTRLRSAPGRMEEIKEGQPFKVIIDYAHSPASLEVFFSTIKPLIRGSIIAVFGACGERDPNTRAPMGKIIDTMADVVVITNDDPYSEDPELIANQVLAGITCKIFDKTIWKILDRRAAIRHALSLARPGDCVCILGKGAEQWQVLGAGKIPWDDRAITRELLAPYRHLQPD